MLSAAGIDASAESKFSCCLSSSAFAAAAVLLTAPFWLALPVVWLDGTAQPVSAKNKAMVPNRVGNRKFIDVSPSGSGRIDTTLLNNADTRPGRQMRARPARMRAGG
ncbi:hypothetical protein BVIET440_210042 [Burkholderia vietnamiensis]